MQCTATKKLILSLSIAAALGCASGAAFADGDSTSELEARVAELEALVRELMAERQAPADCCVDVDAKAAAAAESALAAYRLEQEEKAKKNSYAVGGYIKTDLMWSNYDGGPSSGAGRDFYIPGTIPVGTSAGETYFDAHAKESRINFKSTHLLDSGHKLGTFVEFDFLLSSQGDERVSNSYSPRLRHAFFTYDNWLFGQTWMTFFNVGALPENLDFVGPAESTIFGRQAMIRYTKGPWQFAIENAETTVTHNGGRVVTDDSHVPDFVARYNMSGEWGDFTIAGILRDLRYETVGINDNVNGWGISLSGKFNMGKDDFRWMLSTGKGLGRYIGLNTANAAVVTPNGSLEAIDQTGVFGSYRHLWSDKWRSNFTLGYLKVDNPVQYTGASATKDASSMHVNLIYSPVPKFDFGVELMMADREIESGLDGQLTRLQFSAKYAY